MNTPTPSTSSARLLLGETPPRLSRNFFTEGTTAEKSSRLGLSRGTRYRPRRRRPSRGSGGSPFLFVRRRAPGNAGPRSPRPDPSEDSVAVGAVPVGGISAAVRRFALAVPQRRVLRVRLGVASPRRRVGMNPGREGTTVRVPTKIGIRKFSNPAAPLVADASVAYAPRPAANHRNTRHTTSRRGVGSPPCPAHSP